MKVILDTDIGTDVDDSLALALLLASPEVELLGVTCVYGDTVLRARIAHKLLTLRQRTEIPVLVGARKPLLGLRDIYWEGHEGQGLIDEDDPPYIPQPDFAPDWIVRMARMYPGEIHLIVIGPLTNLALALRQEPELPKLLAGVAMMGGVVRENDGFDLPIAEHNIICDPDAAHIVLSSGLPIRMAPLNITVQTRVTRRDLHRIQAVGTPFHLAIADQLARYPRFVRQDWASPHDPMAVTAILRPDFFQFTQVDVHVETAGRVSSGAIFPQINPVGNVQLITGLDIPAFEAYLRSRLEA